ncbi:MAG TPA: acyl-CoA dehydrogenase [Mycobacteriales bacterium]|nr:acyl-CoA dehydrogenase [Mycobacteriales bacterium]
MPIGVTEEHDALRDSARDLLARRCPLEVVREAVDAEVEQLPAYWADAAELGWLGLAVPEEYGGAGFGLAESAVVAEELGRAVAPGQLLPTMHAASVLAADGGAAAKELLADVVAGTTPAAVAIGCPPVAGSAVAAGVALDGVVRPVLGGAVADLLVAPVSVDGALVWCAIDVAGRARRPVGSLDLARRMAEVDLAGVVVPPERQLTISAEDVADIGAVLYAAETCGLAGWCLDEATRHAKERVQFGRPIGTFQAIKHRCADLLALVEQMRAAVWDAARTADDGESRQLAVASAAAIAFDGAVRAAEDCVQVLGGIGFTWEHDAHLYLRRAVAVRQVFGPTSSWRTRTATLALRGVRRTLDVELPAEADEHRGAVQEFLQSLQELDDDARRRRLADEGYLSPHWPRPWGRSAGAVEQLVIDEEFRRAKVRRPHLSIAAWVLPTLIEHGTPAQQERWIRPTLYGEISWCQLFSEPGAGSDLASLTTRAERTDGGWLVTGQKVWTSMARQSSHGILLARTTPITDGNRHAGITYFLLDMSTSGIDIRPLRELTGQAMFNEVFLDGVFVPDDCVVGDVDDGWRLARTTLANERVQMSSGSAFGTGVDALLQVMPEAADAVALDRLGALVAEARALGLMGYRQMLRALRGSGPGAESSLRKLIGAEHEQRVQEYGIELLGVDGATSEGAAGGWTHGFLATRCLTIAGGTSEVQRNVIGERLLGLPRDAP